MSVSARKSRRPPSALLALAAILLAVPAPATADLRNGLMAYRNYAYDLAREQFLESARAGEPESQYYLGEIHEGGVGREIGIDYARALDWYRRAAEQGHARAQRRLAKLYSDGRGTQADPHRAFQWLRRAADNGDVVAQYRLGRRYAHGLGTDPDPVAAYKWLTIAAQYGEPSAPELLRALQGALKRDQREQAERAALAWERRWDAGDHSDPHYLQRPGRLP